MLIRWASPQVCLCLCLCLCLWFVAYYSGGFNLSVLSGSVVFSSFDEDLSLKCNEKVVIGQVYNLSYSFLIDMLIDCSSFDCLLNGESVFQPIVDRFIGENVLHVSKSGSCTWLLCFFCFFCLLWWIALHAELSDLTFISNNSSGCKHNVFDYISYACSACFILIVFVVICRMKKHMKGMNANGQMNGDDGNMNQSLLSSENPTMVNGGSSYSTYFPANFNPTSTSTSNTNTNMNTDSTTSFHTAYADSTTSFHTAYSNSTSVPMDNNNPYSNSAVDNNNNNNNSQYNSNYGMNYGMNYNIPQPTYPMNYGYPSSQNPSMH